MEGSYSSKKKSEPVNIFNNNAPNYGVQGNNITISPIPIPPIDNFSIKEIPGSPEQFVYEIKPKEGVWYRSFVGYPANEDSLVQGDYRYNANINTTLGETTATVELPIGGTKIMFKVLSKQFPFPISFHQEILFFCKVRPSFLIFGEIEGKTLTKIYMKNL